MPHSTAGFALLECSTYVIAWASLSQERHIMRCFQVMFIKQETLVSHVLLLRATAAACALDVCLISPEVSS